MGELKQGTWIDTRLWKALCGRDGEPSDSLQHALRGILPKVESILISGSSEQTDFTLHDAGHAWRVAERMADLAGAGLLAELGPQDLALLLLSAYLHDIGMTPRVAQLRSHHDFLLSGDTGLLDEEECEQLQMWLDDEFEGLLPPISTGTPTANDLRVARRALAGYVRHRHNEWSARWIAENIPHDEAPYPNWVDDIIRLCKSHHFDIDELKTPAFSPKLVGAPGTVLHLRFCACLLRVADVLDIDPERTPGILFSHRDVSASSAIYWHKDHDISFVQKGNHISLYAEPPDALTHHAIQLTISDVDRELLLSRRLADETHFQRMAGEDEDLPHRWTLDTNVRAVVQPKDGAYEYIDGTFKPDPKKILSLLAGVELYGSHFATVREALQNAFDAVREQIARELLNLPDPADPANRERISQVHDVTLELGRCPDGLRLTVRDTGTGMTREIIRQRFLVGGKTSSHEIRALERTCAEHGVQVGRTAKFGIGVLSYFLLGSSLRLTTHRSNVAGDVDGTGWTFTSAGLDDFGELRQQPSTASGTELEITVRSELTEDEEEFARELAAYVSREVTRVPCRFSFSAPEFDVPAWSVPPGWIERAGEVEAILLSAIADNDSSFGDRVPLELKAQTIQERHRQSEEFWQETRRRAGEKLTLHTYDGVLPNGLGMFRISYGLFQLSCGPSPGFLEILDPEDGADQVIFERLEGSDCKIFDGDVRMSWNGMRLEGSNDRMLVLRRKVGRAVRGTSIEIDWTSDAAGQLAVHRNDFEPSKAAIDATEIVAEKAEELLEARTFCSDDSPLDLVNAQLINRATVAPKKIVWPGISRRGKREFEEFKLPAIDRSYDRFSDLGELYWRGSAVSVVPSIQINGTTYGDNPTWHGNLFGPSILGLVRRGEMTRPIPVWEHITDPAVGMKSSLHTATFPPEWASVVVAERPNQTSGKIWNASHPLVRAIGPDDLKWATETFAHIRDPLPRASELLATPSKAAAWSILCIWWGEQSIWNGLRDRASDFLNDVWVSIEGLAGQECLCVPMGRFNYRTSLQIVSQSSWVTLDEDVDGELARRLQEPDDEWWLTYSNGTRELKRASGGGI